MKTINELIHLQSLRTFIKLAFATFCLVLVRPTRDLVRTMRRVNPVRIYTLHRLSSSRTDGMTISPEELHERIRYIQKFHDIVSLPQAIQQVRSGQMPKRPMAAITFDDGYLSVFTDAAPTLAQYGLVGACFLVTEYIGLRNIWSMTAN